MSIVEEIQRKSPSRDQITLSNYDQFKVLKTDLHLDVIFEKKILNGLVRYALESIADAKEIILDTSFLDVQEVTVDGKKVEFTIGERKGTLGSQLIIPTIGTDIYIVFQTTDKCTAVQFVQGDTGEFVFSQCQPVHARSLFPCFDTPGVKSPYNFSCTSKYECLMSGRPAGNENGIFKFHQPIPIPSYLVSITSGKLKSAPIGPRSLVYTEEPNLADCKWEFEHDMENFLQIAENLIFGYEWSTFDVLVLPSSFPYGGMEIPNVTQVTPTLISKDRTQVKVIAHELAHSWSGNLVTNSSWSHFWLNEGWTVYLERRILGVIAVKEKTSQGSSLKEAIAYGELVRNFEALIGWNALSESVNEVELKFTSLIWDFANSDSDPDDAFSRVPYEKGFNFIFHIERKLTLEVFDPFIKHYFRKFRYTSLDSAQFVKELYDFYPEKTSILDSIDWDTWLFGQGLPEYPNFDASLADEVNELVGQWEEFIGGKSNSIPFTEASISGYSTNQKILLLESLQKLAFTPEVARQLPKVYPTLHEATNTEILTKWNALLITYANWGKNADQVVFFATWLGSVGRMKYVRPGYRLLMSSIGRDFAVETFEKYEGGYHPIARAMVKKDLGL